MSPLFSLKSSIFLINFPNFIEVFIIIILAPISLTFKKINLSNSMSDILFVLILLKSITRVVVL